MTKLLGFLQALLAKPEDADTRGVFADWLDDNNLWTWEAVRHIVCEHPHIAGLRLLAADWLDRHEQQWRGDFIRLQCEMWRMRRQSGPLSRTVPWPVADSRYSLLQQAEREFMSQNLWRLLRDEFPEGISGEMDRWYPRGDMIISKDGDVRLTFSRGFADSISCPLHQWYGYGRTLVALQPIEVVSITGHIPEDNARSLKVPEPIRRHLWHTICQDEFAALEDLNAACLAWARAAAGLRPLRQAAQPDQ